MASRPFTRWWWNGDKVEKSELARELRLLRDAGFGGVEINPIAFPERTEDMGIASIDWLSPAWLELLRFTLGEAASLEMTCDLIVGSGWPFGAPWLAADQRSRVRVISAIKLEGPVDYEAVVADLMKDAYPAISAPFAGRVSKLISLHLVPSPLNSLDEVKEIPVEAEKKTYRISVPSGSHLLYGLVEFDGFSEVINGAPGANGPVLNHYDKAAVENYLHRMSDALGPLTRHIRCFFTDSLELEGANWCEDMETEFLSRRGYALKPYLPFILYKTGGMGNNIDPEYGARHGEVFRQLTGRVRFDFDLTKTELLRERFIEPFLAWCKENKVLSRMQAYGRGYDPLDGSLGVDIPECETWIKEGLGTQMSEDDYRLGRAYTMINKYISSAAHLQGKKIVSCEELTNTDRVFNETLELLKVGSDQSVISGVTHAVFHGFNYSPREAAFPGWVRYGTYFNERNPWWTWLAHFTTYRARLTAMFQEMTMYAGIALLPPIADTWNKYGAQNTPFPTLIHPTYQPLVWEAIHKNGDGCDYVSEKTIRAGLLKKYHTLFLIEVESLSPDTAKALYQFVAGGGRIFCIETIPLKAESLMKPDAEVQEWVSKMKSIANRFILLKKPAKDFIGWYRQIQQDYSLKPYVTIDRPNPFVNQIRYGSKHAEAIFFINSNMEEGYHLELSFAPEITAGKWPWLWDAVTGERYRLELAGGATLKLDLGPADSKLIVFDKNKRGKVYNATPAGKGERLTGWLVEWQHIDGTNTKSEMEELKDVKEIPAYVSFSGIIIYRKTITLESGKFLDLGKVYGVSELSINGVAKGVQWYGKRLFPLEKGENKLEITVTATMGNYLKTLTKNPVAQYWTNAGRKEQPIQSMGMAGPVTIYSRPEAGQ
jgi:alpha-L-rhamnosidase